MLLWHRTPLADDLPLLCPPPIHNTTQHARAALTRNARIELDADAGGGYFDSGGVKRRPAAEAEDEAVCRAAWDLAGRLVGLRQEELPAALRS